MVSFNDLRKQYSLQKQAKQVRKELKNIHVEAEASGVKVVISGEIEVVSITIDPGVDMARLPELIKDAFNRAVKKAQLVSSEKMQGVMSQMGLSAQ
jgi:nucleoid-associated protein EbfC